MQATGVGALRPPPTLRVRAVLQKTYGDTCHEGSGLNFIIAFAND